MRYFGGKQRIAGRLGEWLNQEALRDLPYLEPFVGSGAVMCKVAPGRDRTGCDINPSLMLLLSEVRDGTFPYPDSVTEEDYQRYKVDPEPSAMKAFVGFGCSFAGKWFGGYARDSTGGNYVSRCHNSLEKKRTGWSGATFQYKDYRELTPTGCLVYCDPPYVGTTKIFTGGFNTQEFWDVIRTWSRDNMVFISEYCAPEDFQAVLEIPTTTNIRGGDGNVIPRVEKLFTMKEGAWKH